jgi:hypothetical protein
MIDNIIYYTFDELMNKINWFNKLYTT